MNLEEALKILKKAGVVLYKSKYMGYIYFAPADLSELPKGLSTEKNIKKQQYGTFYTEIGLIKLAETL